MHLSWRRPVSGFCSAALSHTKNGGSGSGTGGMCGRQKTAGCAVCDCHRRVRTVREPARQSDSARNRSDARCYRRNSRHCYAPEPSVLRIGKNLGLALFFTGTGVSAGLQIHALQPMTVLYGLLVTWTALAVGFFCTGRFFGRFHLHRGCVIAGGMTSSPALGTLLQKCADPPLFQFSAAYFGALLSLTVLLYFL